MSPSPNEKGSLDAFTTAKNHADVPRKAWTGKRAARKYIDIPMKVFHDPADFDPAQIAKLVFVTEDQDAAARALTDLGTDFVALGLASGPRRRAGEWMT